MITIRHEHYFHFEGDDAARIAGLVAATLAPLLSALERRLMGDLSDRINAAIDKADAALDAAIARVQGDVAVLTKTIADLTAQLGTPGLTADEADAIHDRIADLTAQLGTPGLTADEADAIHDRIDELTQKLDAADPNKPTTLPA